MTDNQNHVFATWQEQYNNAQRGQHFALRTLLWCLIIPLVVFVALYALVIFGQLPQPIIDIYVKYCWIAIVFCAILNIVVMGFFVAYSVRIRHLLKQASSLGKTQKEE